MRETEYVAIPAHWKILALKSVTLLGWMNSLVTLMEKMTKGEKHDEGQQMN